MDQSEAVMRKFITGYLLGAMMIPGPLKVVRAEPDLADDGVTYLDQFVVALESGLAFRVSVDMIGDDGLTDTEREAHAADYAAGAGTR